MLVEEEIEVNISFSFTNPLVLGYEELTPVGDVNEFLLIGVSAIDENGNDVSDQVYVLDDGGFAEFASSVLRSEGIGSGGRAGGSGGRAGGSGSRASSSGGSAIGGLPGIIGGPAPIAGFETLLTGSKGVSPAGGGGIYDFDGEVTYAAEHPKNGEVFVSDPREVLVRKDMGVLEYQDLIPLDVDIPGDLAIDKVAVPGVGSSMVNNIWEWDITLTLRGLDLITTSDIVLAIDSSGSMGFGENSKMTYAKNAALLFVRELLKGDGRTRIALVDYNRTATVRSGLTTDLGALEGAINSLSALGGTNIQDGIAKAQELLSTSTANNKYIVLLSDGEPTHSYAATAVTNVTITSCVLDDPVWSVTADNVNTTNFSMLFDETDVVGDGGGYYIDYTTGADAGKGALIPCPSGHNHPFPPNNGISAIYQAKGAKSDNINIYSVAVAAGDIGEMVLQQCASGVGGADHVYAISDSTPGELDKLAGIFSEISGKILFAANSAVVTDPVGEMFNLISSINTSKGTATFNSSVAPGTITWNVGDVREIDDGITMKYTVRIDNSIANPETMYPTNKTTVVNYIDVYGDNTSKPFPVPQVGYPQVGSITQMIYAVDDLGRPLDAQGQPAASRDLIDIIEMSPVINPAPVATDPYVFYYGTYTVIADLYRTINGENYQFVQGTVLNMGEVSPTSVTVDVTNQSARVYYAYRHLEPGWLASNWERLREAINVYSAPTITIYPGGYVNDDGIPEIMIGGVPVLEDLAAGRLVVIDNDDPGNGGTNQAIWRTSNGIESGIWVDRAVTIVAYGDTTAPLISRDIETTRHFYVQPDGSLVVDRGIVIDGNKDANISSGDTVGGVRVSGGVFALRPGASIINSRTYIGGGVSVVNNGVFTMGGGDIRGNEAWLPGAIIPDTGLGGGVYVSGGQFIMTGGSISENTAGSSGGGVYVASGEFTMNGAGSISNNNSRMGGGVRVFEGTFTLTSGSIDNNVSNVGGGVNVGKSESDTGIGHAYFHINGGTINNNSANSNGGGVAIYKDGTTVMTGGEIVYNESEGSGGGVVVARGAAFSLVSGRINNNLAMASGGGLILDDGMFTMTGGEINNNEAILHGGGISINGSAFIMGGGGIVGNKAGIAGGGVDVVGVASQFTMGGGEINQNEANNGGGVAVEGGSFTINSGLIRANTATSNGGGIFIDNGVFTLGNGTISDNIAVNENGGGVYLFSIREGGTVDIEYGSIINNKAESGNGGGVYIYSVGAGRVFEMKGGSINANEALHGGGIHVRDVAATGRFELSGGAIINNEAAYDGGGIFTANHRWMNIGAGVGFSGNTAGYGAYRLDEYLSDGVYDPGAPITVGELIALHGVAAQIRTTPLYSTPNDGKDAFLYLANNFDLNFNGEGTLKPGVFNKVATGHTFNGVGDVVEYTVSYELPSIIGGYEGFLIFDNLLSTVDYLTGSGSVAINGAPISSALVRYNTATRTVNAYIPKGNLIDNALIEVKFSVTVNSNWLADGGPITNTAYYIIDRTDDGAEPGLNSGNADGYAQETVYPTVEKPGDFTKEAALVSKSYRPGVTPQYETFDISFTVPVDDNLSFYMVRILDTYDPELTYFGYELLIGGVSVPTLSRTVNNRSAINEVEFIIDGAELESYAGQEFSLSLTFGVAATAKNVLTNNAKMFFEREGDPDDDPADDDAEIPPMIDKPDDFAKEAAAGSKSYIPRETAQVKFDVSYTVPNDPYLSYYTIRIVDTFYPGITYANEYLLTVNGLPVPTLPRTVTSSGNQVVIIVNGADLADYADQELNISLTFNVLPIATAVLRNRAEFNYDLGNDEDDNPIVDEAIIPPVAVKPGDFVKDAAPGSKWYRPGITTEVMFEVRFTVPATENLVLYTMRIVDSYDPMLTYAGYIIFTVGGIPVPGHLVGLDPDPLNKTLTITLDGAYLIDYMGEEVYIGVPFYVSSAAAGVLENEAEMYFDRDDQEDEYPVWDDAEIPPVSEKPDDFMKDAAMGSKMYTPGVTTQVKFDISYTVPNDPYLSYYSIRIRDTYDAELTYANSYTLTIGGVAVALTPTVTAGPASNEVSFTIPGAALESYIGQELVLSLTFNVSPTADGVLENTAEFNYDREGDEDDDPIEDTAEIPPTIAKPNDFEKVAASGSKTYMPGVTTHVTFDVSHTIPNNPLLSYYTIRITDTYQIGLTYNSFQLSIGGVVMPATFPIIATPSGNTVVFEVAGADLLAYAGEVFSLALTFNVSPTATGVLVNSAEFNYVRDGQEDDDPIEDDDIIPPVVDKPADFAKEAATGSKWYKPGVTAQVAFDVSFTIPGDENLEYYTVRIVDSYDAFLSYSGYALTIDGSPVPFSPIVNTTVTGVVTFTFNGADLAAYADDILNLKLTFNVSSAAEEVLVNRADMYFDLGDIEDEDPIGDSAEIPPLIDYPDDFMKEAATGSKFYRPGVTAQVTFDISFTVPDDLLLSYYDIRIVDTFEGGLSYAGYALTIDSASVSIPRDVNSEPLANRVTFTIKGADLVAHAGKTLNITVIFNVSPTAKDVLVNTAEFNYVRDGQPGDDPITDVAEIPPEIAKPEDFEKSAAAGSETYRPGITTQVTFDVSYTVPVDPYLSYYNVRIVDTYGAGLTYSGYVLTIDSVAVPAFPIVVDASTSGAVVFVAEGADLAAYAGKKLALALTFNVSPTATGVMVNSAEFRYEREGDLGDPIEDDATIPPAGLKPNDFAKAPATGSQFYTPGVTTQVAFDISFTVPDDENLEFYTVKIVDRYSSELTYTGYTLTIGGSTVPFSPIVNPTGANEATFSLDGAALTAYAGQAFNLAVRFNVASTATAVLENRAELNYEKDGIPDDDPIEAVAEIPPVIEKPNDFEKVAASGSKTYKPGVTAQVIFNVNYTVPSNPLLSYYMVRITDIYEPGLSFDSYVLRIGGVVMPAAFLTVDSSGVGAVVFEVSGASLLTYAGQVFSLALTFDVSPDATGVLVNHAEFNYYREGQPDDPIEDTEEIPPEDVFTVTYDDSGADNPAETPVDGNLYWLGDEVTVLGHGELRKANHIFGGWRHSGTGEILREDDVFEIDGDVTLTAVWIPFGETATKTVISEADAYEVGDEVTYEIGYTLVDDEDVFDAIETVTIVDSYLPPDALSFKSGVVLVNGEPVTGSGLIESEGNKVTVNLVHSQLSAGAEIAVQLTYTIESTETSITNKAVVIINGEPTDDGDEETLYKVTYIGTDADNPSEAPVDAKLYKPGAEVTVLGHGALKKSGYVFAGWNGSADGTGAGYAAGGTFVIIANTNLHSVWAYVTDTFEKDSEGVTYAPGGNIDYKITYSLPDEEDLEKYKTVRIVDIYESSLTYAGFTLTINETTIAPETVTVTQVMGKVTFELGEALIELYPGGKIALTVTFGVAESAAGKITNKAELYVVTKSGGEPEEDEPPPREDEEVDLEPVKNFQKVAGGSFYKVGDAISFTVSFELPEDSDGYEGLLIYDKLPDVLTYQDASAVIKPVEGENIILTPTQSDGAVSVYLTGEQIHENEKATVELIISTTVNENWESGNIENTAKLFVQTETGDDNKPDPEVDKPDKEDTVIVTPITPVEDFRKTSGSDFNKVGDIVRYTISAKLPADISMYNGLLVYDKLPSTLTYNAEASSAVIRVSAGGEVLRNLTITYNEETGSISVYVSKAELTAGSYLEVIIATDVNATWRSGAITNTAQLFYQRIPGDNNKPDPEVPDGPYNPQKPDHEDEIVIPPSRPTPSSRPTSRPRNPGVVPRVTITPSVTPAATPTPTPVRIPDATVPEGIRRTRPPRETEAPTEPVEIPDVEVPEGVQVPQTGVDSMMPMLIAGLLGSLLIVAICVFFIIMRRKKRAQ